MSTPPEMPTRPPMPVRPPKPIRPGGNQRKPEPTRLPRELIVAAIMGLSFAVLGMVGFVRFRSPLLGIVGFICGIPALAAIHYIVWGHWLLQYRTEDDVRDTTYHQPFNVTHDNRSDR